MNSAVPDIQGYPHCRTGRSGSLLAFGLATLLLFTVILCSSHHHQDLKEHPGCAVCAFVHHADATASAVPVPLIVTLPVLPVLYILHLLTLPTIRPASLLRSRAPPT